MSFMKIKDWDKFIFVDLIILLALLTRIFLIDFKSMDYKLALDPWYDFIKNNGGFLALKSDIFFYTPPYLYLLVFSTFLPIHKIIAIKSIPIPFDFLLAFFVYLIVKLKYKKGLTPIFSFFVTFFLPTVLLNGTFWGQFDVIHTTGILASLYFLMNKKYLYSFIALGIALSFKTQAIFILPVFVFLYFRKEVSLKYFFILPIVYLILILPAVLLGRNFLDLILIFSKQANKFPSLTINAPNIYQWIPYAPFKVFDKVGILLTAAVFLILGYIFYKSHKKTDNNTLVRLSLLSTLIMPFLLPRMHDRYFYSADVISIIYAFYFPKYFYVPIIIQATSFFTYGLYLFGSSTIDLSYLAMLLFIAVIIVTADFIKSVSNENQRY